ncbi:MAG: dockerin, partial [Planctomycetia bacterium]|nr:dockerin [Planctomycetia bacterium]
LTLTLLFGFAAGQAVWATETENLGIKPFPFVHPLFSDNMVLPRDVPAPVWGWTTPGAKVTVSIAGKNVVATADENGRWLAKVGPFPASDKGQTLTITGPQTVTI